MKYIIGDIHGCYLTLKALYKKIKDNEVYSVGDIIDKGEDSALCLDFIIKNKIKTVKGNHENFFEIYIPRYLCGEDISNTKWYKLWGGDKTIKSYNVYKQGEKKKKMLEHLAFIKTLPLYLIIEEKDEKNKKCLITHGFGLPYEDKLKDLDTKSKQAIMCNRLFGPYFDIEKEREVIEKSEYINVFGHDAFKDIYKDDCFYGIDTGCTYGSTEKYGGKLSAIGWPSKEIISVDVIDNVDYVFEGE